MSGRKCGNCRHYETSPIWRSGWCRNPRLYSPQESHLVSQDNLECAHRVGNYWEPIEPEVDSEDGTGRLGRRSRVHPLRLFGPQPRLVAATASGGGGSGTGPTRPPRSGSTGGGQPVERSERYVARPAETAPGREPRGAAGASGYDTGPGRPVQPGGMPGQERPVSYQPEERYWTDYLRIALPVVGLLLMLGLFWFWAASLIGDEDDDDPDNLAAVATATPTPPPPSPSPSPGGATGAQETATNPATNGEPSTTDGGATDTDPAADTNADSEGTDGETAPDDTGEQDPDAAECEVEYCSGELVVTTSDVNFRSSPTTEEGEDNILDLIPSGEELEVTGDAEEGDDGNTWIEVVFNGETGFIATTTVEPSG